MPKIVLMPKAASIALDQSAQLLSLVRSLRVFYNTIYYKVTQGFMFPLENRVVARAMLATYGMRPIFT
ncbi:hypothetical protein DPMN_005343 [Dreissena polymorpha]|uniref:Uncharacterized protein n=1 Tax=Dreissena polymorpha TaxID=45954 RepID=A0A9D4RTT5_DREPO|nr:hypothetical protein DPMN_005343 [Dreissena polymorpha]